MMTVEERRECSPKSKKQRQSSPSSHIQPSAGSGGNCSDTEVFECLGVALSSWNEKSLSKMGPEYELVAALGCNRMAGPTIYHCNFLARLKNKSEAENKIFFAELKYSKEFSKDGKDAALGCSVCCILGPHRTFIKSHLAKKGSAGCGICKLHPVQIHHPIDEMFIKGRLDAFDKFIAKKESAYIKKWEKRSDPSIAPRVQLCFNWNLPPPEKEVHKCVDLCLSSWNEKSLLEQGPEFALVDVVACNRSVGPFICHCNFIAKPKNGRENESKLFFGEVMFKDNLDRKGCTTCCILGPSETITGLCGCIFCESRSGIVQHPENGEFTKGRDDALSKRRESAPVCSI